MIKQIGRNVLAVVVGTVIGMAAMTALHRLSGLVYPMPAGVDPMSSDPAQQAQLKAWFATLPAGAFVLATLAHGAGSLIAALVATLIEGRKSLRPAIIVGVLFTIAGIMNLREIPHPAWFGWVDLPVYLPLAVLAGLGLRRRG